MFSLHHIFLKNQGGLLFDNLSLSFEDIGLVFLIGECTVNESVFSFFFRPKEYTGKIVFNGRTVKKDSPGSVYNYKSAVAFQKTGSLNKERISLSRIAIILDDSADVFSELAYLKSESLKRLVIVVSNNKELAESVADKAYYYKGHNYEQFIGQKKCFSRL